MSTNAEEAECPVVQNLIKNLKSGTKNDIYACLTSLKKDTRHHRQFAKEGGLVLLVKLLYSKNLKILDLLLSVLANACLNGYIRQEMRGVKAAAQVVSILKNVKLGSSLQCRACRLIGNLAECSWHAQSLCDAGVVQALTNILKSSKCSEKNLFWTKTTFHTQLMAIRAVRNIWTGLESSREEILEMGTIREITAVFVVANEKDHKNVSELIQVCLKAMCAFLGNSYPQCGEQMRGEFDGQGYKNIVEYCKKKDKIAMKCLYSLCQIAECRPILGSCGAVECLIRLLTDDAIVCSEVLACLCLFCREAVNRAKIRYGGGLEVMLYLLKKVDNDRYHPMLLHALAQFVYDDQSIFIMVKNGLLDVLIDKLNQMTLELPKDLEEKSNSKKRSADSSLDKRAEVKFNRTNFGRYSLDYKRDDWSPGSATSMCSSPPSTPPLLSLCGDEIDENTEDNYSPVCSDTEWAENDEEPEDEIESLKSFSSVAAEPAESQDFRKLAANQQAYIWTLALLSRLSHSNDPVDRLADPATIQALVAYIRAAKNARASRILTRIVRNRAYLVPLLKQGFAFEAQTLYGSEQYTRQLCALAETGGALGELASILLRGQEIHKFVIAVSIPFLIKSKEALRTLLKIHGGLSLIFHVLVDRTHDLHDNAVCAVSQLANTLEIQPETIDRNQLDCIIPINYPKSFSLHHSIVTFELDDGTTIDACRNILCQKSDVFSAMLEGNFSESGKRRVKLKNTSKEGLNTLLLAMNGISFDNQTIESLLDAVLLADKFLMHDVSEMLTESSISSLNFQNLSRAWHWAQNNACYELKISCMKIFLTAKLTKPERLKAFEDFSQSERFSEFIDDMKQVLTTGLGRY